MANEITSKTSLVALFGDPVEHSISPQIQNQAFKTLQLPLVYLAFRVSKEELPQAVAGAWAMGFMGFNVTIPHKQAMLSLVDELAPSARILGAVNTVRRDGKKLIGYNTDGEGFTRAMQEELGITIASASVWKVTEHDYPHALVRLHWCKVREWTGQFEMREGQSMAWQTFPLTVEPVLPGAYPVLDWLEQEQLA